MSQQINLYNAAFVPKREWLTAQNVAIGLGAVILLLTAIGVPAAYVARQRAAELVAVQAQTKLAQGEMEAAQAAIRDKKASEALQADIERAKRKLENRSEVLAVVREGIASEQGGAGFSEYLAGLARQSRDGVWVTGFSAAAGGNNMVLRGRALDKNLLPGYVRRLKAEPAFGGKSFAGLRVEYRVIEPEQSAVSPAPTLAGAAAALGAPAPSALTNMLAPLSSIVPGLSSVLGAAPAAPAAKQAFTPAPGAAAPVTAAPVTATPGAPTAAPAPRPAPQRFLEFQLLAENEPTKAEAAR